MNNCGIMVVVLKTGSMTDFTGWLYGFSLSNKLAPSHQYFFTFPRSATFLTEVTMGIGAWRQGRSLTE